MSNNIHRNAHLIYAYKEYFCRNAQTSVLTNVSWIVFEIVFFVLYVPLQKPYFWQHQQVVPKNYTEMGIKLCSCISESPGSMTGAVCGYRIFYDTSTTCDAYCRYVARCVSCEIRAYAISGECSSRSAYASAQSYLELHCKWNTSSLTDKKTV